MSNKYSQVPADRKGILQFSFDMAFREWADLWDAWRLLEAKAQATLATAGILEAGAFAYITQLNPKPGVIGQCLLIVLVLVLGISVVSGMRSIQVGSSETPFKGLEGHERILSAITESELPNSLSGLSEDLLEEATVRVCRSNGIVHAQLELKAVHLKRSQSYLGCAAFLVLPLVISTFLLG